MNGSLDKKQNCSGRKRYHGLFFGSMAAYCLAVAAISGWFGWEPPKTGLGLYLAAISPALPIGVAIFAMGCSIASEPDEFLRMIQVKAMLISLGLTMFTCTAWGFLAQYAHVWALPLYFVFAIWIFWWALARPLVSWRYR